MDYTTLIIAIIAGIVCYQLYAKLGTRSDTEDDKEPHKRPTLLDGGLSESPPASPKAHIDSSKQDGEPVTVSGAPAWVNEIRKRYPGFDDSAFLEGAKSAYEMIVTAYGTMDLSSIKPFVQREIFNAFNDSIQAKCDKGHRSEFQFVGVEKAEVMAHEVTAKDIFVSVSFTSNQVRSEYDKDGNLIEGDPNRIDFVKDHWRFHRSVNAKDPNWVLAATGIDLGAEG